MDYSQYEIYDFDSRSAFNLSTGYKERSYKMHWHSYGEIMLVGPGNTNIYQVNQDTYELAPGDIVMIWPMEMHAVIDADRTEALVIQFSNAFMNSLFDLQRIMHPGDRVRGYRDLIPNAVHVDDGAVLSRIFQYSGNKRDHVSFLPFPNSLFIYGSTAPAATPMKAPVTVPAMMRAGA